MIASKVSVQGVKSLWGACRVFPVLGTFVYAPPVSVPGAQYRKNAAIAPK